MKRIFGVGKKPTPPPTIDDTSIVLEKRGDSIDVKIAKLDKELMEYREQLKKVRPGPSQARIKQKALHVLKRKRMYEQQRSSIYNQQFKLDEMAFAHDSIKGTVDQVSCMKGFVKDMKKDMKQINIDKVEDLQDEMQDLFDESQDITEVLGRSYGVPEEVDENTLQAEFDALGDEIATDASYSTTQPIVGTSALPTVGPKPNEEVTDPDQLEQQLGL
jgi:charged multivesicular body protein 5